MAIFTPYMLYFAVFCILFVFLQPHLRFIVKSLPVGGLVLVGILILGGVVALIMNMINHPNTIMELLFAEGFEIGKIGSNLASGFVPVFAWWGGAESTFLAPLMSLPILGLALIGLLSTTQGFFASRNSIASLLLVFTVIITAFNPEAVIFFILPIAILVAHGLKYLLEKWYGLFPENPYARVAAIIPLSILFGVILIPSLIQYVYGYRYNPGVAEQFNYDVPIIRENLTDEAVIAGENYDFYKILEGSTDLKVVSELGEESPEKVAVLHNVLDNKKYKLSKIIASPMREKSDIIYLYTVKGE